MRLRNDYSDSFKVGEGKQAYSVGSGGQIKLPNYSPAVAAEYGVMNFLLKEVNDGTGELEKKIGEG